MLDLFNMLIRYVVVFFGVRLVEKGILEQAMIEPLIGILMTVLAIGWALVKNGYITRLRKWWNAKTSV